LADCLSQWTLVDEEPYLVDIHPADRAKASAATTPGETTDAETISDADTDDAKPMKRNGNTRLRIIVSVPADREGGSGGEAEDSDDGAEGGGVEGELEDPDDRSPIEELKTFDWGSADDELAEFLAEDDDGEGNDADEGGAGRGENDGESDAPPPGTKRKHDEETDSDGHAHRDRDDGSAPKKQRVAKGRSASGLRAVHTPETGDGKGSLPTPQVAGDEAEVMLLKVNAGRDTQGDGDDIDEDELEADLMAELAAEEALAENG